MSISKALRQLIKNISFPKILIQRERDGFTFFIENLLHAYIVFGSNLPSNSAPNSSDPAQFNFLCSWSLSLPSPLCKPLSLRNAAHMYVGVRSSTEEWKKEVLSMVLVTEGVFWWTRLCKKLTKKEWTVTSALSIGERMQRSATELWPPRGHLLSLSYFNITVLGTFQSQNIFSQ